MRKNFLLFVSAPVLLLLATQNTSASDRGRRLNITPPESVRRLVKRAVRLAEGDQPAAAVAALKKAITASPDYLRAHIEYRNVKANFLDQSDDVQAEYESLIRRDPANPVYLMAVYYRSDGKYGREFLERVVEVAPEWAWSHYAKALLLRDEDPAGAAAQLRLCLEKDGGAGEAYHFLIEIQEQQLKRIDDALRTAERLAARSDIRGSRFEQLWRLRLVKAQWSDGAKEELRGELLRLANDSHDVDVLLAVRSAYLNLLKDDEGARAAEGRIIRADPTWYPQRGWLYTQIITNQSGIPRYVVLVNRQIVVHEKVSRITNEPIPPREQVARLEKLLRAGPTPAMRRIIYEKIFRAAIRAGEVRAAVRYGEALLADDPEDHALSAHLALVLADKRRDLGRALRHARRAESRTSQFRPSRRPRNTHPELFKARFPEQKQREAYRKNRALALDALGWALVRAGRVHEAEPWLRRAVEVERSEARLTHLAKALRELGKVEEAIKFEHDANTFLADSVRARFVDEKVKDFELSSINGQKYKLSDLKGKVVLINFWATWCVPCVQEMPALVKLYENYRGKGLEILAVSTDEEQQKVRQFVAERGLNFPVFSQTAADKLFDVGPIPTSIFIDRRGSIRYRKTGFEYGDEREVEVIVSELMK